MASRLKCEIIASLRLGPRNAIVSYRKRRKAVERGKLFLASARAHLEHAEDINAADVVDELYLLIKALEETL